MLIEILYCLHFHFCNVCAIDVHDYLKKGNDDDVDANDDDDDDIMSIYLH